MEKIMTNGFCELDEQEMMETVGGNILESIGEFAKDVCNGIGYINHQRIWGEANNAANKYIMMNPDSPAAQTLMANPNNYVPRF